MLVEARLARAAPVRFLAVGGHRDDAHGLEARLAAQRLGDLEAVEAGQAEVEEQELRPQPARLGDRAAPVVRDVHLVAGLPEDRGHDLGVVDVVVYHEHAAAEHEVQSSKVVILGFYLFLHAAEVTRRSRVVVFPLHKIRHSAVVFCAPHGPTWRLCWLRKRIGPCGACSSSRTTSIPCARCFSCCAGWGTRSTTRSTATRRCAPRASCAPSSSSWT